MQADASFLVMFREEMSRCMAGHCPRGFGAVGSSFREDIPATAFVEPIPVPITLVDMKILAEVSYVLGFLRAVKAVREASESDVGPRALAIVLAEAYRECTDYLDKVNDDLNGG